MAYGQTRPKSPTRTGQGTGKHLSGAQQRPEGTGSKAPPFPPAANTERRSVGEAGLASPAALQGWAGRAIAVRLGGLLQREGLREASAARLLSGGSRRFVSPLFSSGSGADPPMLFLPGSGSPLPGRRRPVAKRGSRGGAIGCDRAGSGDLAGCWRRALHSGVNPCSLGGANLPCPLYI